MRSSSNSTRTATVARCVKWEDFNDYWLYMYIACSIVSVLGNSLVMALVFANKKLRTTANCFIVNMCASDVFIPLFFLGKYLIFIRYKSASLFICKFVPFIWRVSMAVSVQSLLAISVHRFYAVVFPLRARLQNNKIICVLVIAFIWLFAFATSFPEVFYRKLLFLKRGTYCYNSMAHKDWVTYHLFLLIALVAVPFGAMSVLYTAIIITFYSRSNPPGNSSRMHRQLRRKQNIKLTRTLLTIVIVFFLLCGLYWLMYVLIFSKSMNLSSCVMKVYYIVLTFPSLYSAVNPIMYFIFWKHYRQGLKDTLQGCLYHFTSIKHKIREVRV